jgi:hypothetical protein
MNFKFDKEDNYILYCVSLYQLDTKHAGIQNNHSTEKMLLGKYDVLKEYNVLENRMKDQTAIFLSGGTSEMLTTQIDFLQKVDYPFYETFTEPDLYNQITSYSIYVPYRIKNIQLSFDDIFKYTNLYLSETEESSFNGLAQLVQADYTDYTVEEIGLKIMLTRLSLL